MPYTVYLKKGEEKRLLQGHSWVYANEVARIEGKDKNGSLAVVRTNEGKFVGKGYINHLSKILVRIFIRDENQVDDENLYLERIRASKDSRTALGYDNCYRAVFAEADNLPALIVDKYGDYLVCQFLSLGIDKQKDRIVDCLVKVFEPKGIYERSDVGVRQKEGLEERTGVLFGEVPDKIIITENNLKMSVDVKTGRKQAISSTKKKTASPQEDTQKVGFWTVFATAADFQSTAPSRQTRLSLATFQKPPSKTLRKTRD